MFDLLTDLKATGADHSPRFSIKTTDGGIFYGPMDLVTESYVLVTVMLEGTSTTLGEALQVAIAISAITTVTFFQDQWGGG